MAGVSRSQKTFTAKQGQYLAYIHLYTRLHRRPPAETDMQEYFRVSPPSVHQMVLTLERAGFIRRQPRVARSCALDQAGRNSRGQRRVQAALILHAQSAI
jgi:repressor LexA